MKIGENQNFLRAALLVLSVICSASVGYARPEFLKYFEKNPYSKPEWFGRCATCHINPNGGGPRNAFGQAFQKNGYKISSELRASFPDRFFTEPHASQQPQVRFDEQHPNVIIVEMNGQKIQIDTATKSYKVLAPPGPLILAAESVPTSSEVAAAEKPAPTVLDHYFVNLPSALPYAKHSLNIHFTHRFDSPPFDETRGGGASNLFGFDGFSISSFGLTYGLTDRIAVSAYRSPLLKTIEMGGEVLILRESDKIPFSLKALASVEGRNNFKLTSANRFLFDHFYGGNFQIVVSRSIGRWAELAFIPTFSTNTRAIPDFTTDKKNTIALGMAGSVKLTRYSALVGEYVPRVTGYVPLGTQPTVSFGIQKMTKSERHVFALVVSKTQATTTGQQILGGNIFTVGFNIYRRIF